MSKAARDEVATAVPTSVAQTADTRTDVDNLRRACDDVVFASPDPNATMGALVRIWLLGTESSEGLLDDLERMAVVAALSRGLELSGAELLDAIGEHERARRVRDAIDAGRARLMEAAARAARLHAMASARGAAA